MLENPEKTARLVAAAEQIVDYQKHRVKKLKKQGHL